MSKNIIIGIYKITSPTNHIYVGQSVDIYKRFAAYKNLQCKTQSRLLTSFKGHGVNAHNFEIIHVCAENELNALEKYYVDLYNCFNTPHGLNLIEGGGSYGKRSEETKTKNSIANSGERHPQFGWKQPESMIKKRVDKLIGRKLKKEQIEKLRAANMGNKYCLGKKHTLETRNKISLAVTGRKYSKERKQRMSEMAKGKPMPKECSFKGRSHSEESKRKLSEKRKGENNPMYGIGLKLILNKETGIYYEGIESACQASGIHKSTLGGKLRGYIKNNTPFIFV